MRALAFMAGLLFTFVWMVREDKVSLFERVEPWVVEPYHPDGWTLPAAFPSCDFVSFPNSAWFDPENITYTLN